MPPNIFKKNSSSANIYAWHNFQYTNLWKWCNWAINQATKWTAKSATSAFPTSVWYFFLDNTEASAQICAFKMRMHQVVSIQMHLKSFLKCSNSRRCDCENRQSFKEFPPVKFDWIPISNIYRKSPDVEQEHSSVAHEIIMISKHANNLLHTKVSQLLYSLLFYWIDERI